VSWARTLARGARRGLQLIDDGTILVDQQAAGSLIEMLEGAGTVGGPPMSPEGALRITTINAAVQLKVNAVRSIPLMVYETSDEDGFKDYARGRNSRIYPLLHDEPNPEQPADELWAQVAGHLAYRRNAFLWKEKFQGGTRTGLVRHLWAIDPRRVRVKRENGHKVFEVSRRVTGPDVDPIRMTADDMLHIKAGMLGPDGLLALNPIQQVRQELSVVAGVREYLAEHIARGANFQGYLYNGDPDVDIDDPERQRIEEQLIDPARGAKGSTRVPLFNAELKWQQIGMTLADQQFMELMGWGAADCAMVMGVPPTLLNVPIRSSSLTYRTTREEDQRFLKYGISPDLTAVESAIGVDGDLLKGSPFVAEFRREAHLAMDTIARYQAHALAIRAGWKTPNEVRQLENLKKVAGGDELLRLGAKPDEETRDLLDLLETYTGAPNGNGHTQPEPSLT